MADPLASFFIGAVTLVAVGIPLVYVMSRLLKIAPRPVAIDNPRREVLMAVLLLVVVGAIVSMATLVVYFHPWHVAGIGMDVAWLLSILAFAWPANSGLGIGAAALSRGARLENYSMITRTWRPRRRRGRSRPELAGSHSARLGGTHVFK